MYSEEYLGGCVIPTIAPNVASSLASAADIQVVNFGEQLVVTRVEFLVTVAVNSTAPAVVTIYERPTFGSTSGQVAVATLSIPNGTAAGTVVYKNVESVKIPQGSQLAFTVTTAATTAGSGYPMFKGFMAVEDPRNIPAMILSV